MKELAPKIESPQDWAKAKNFIPKKDQVIIYEGVKENDTYIVPPKIKIGDGVHTVNELPFEPTFIISYDATDRVLIVN